MDTTIDYLCHDIKLVARGNASWGYVCGDAMQTLQ